MCFWFIGMVSNSILVRHIQRHYSRLPPLAAAAAASVAAAAAAAAADCFVSLCSIPRGEVGLKPAMVSGMIREFPQLLEVRPKRLKAVVRYLWKVRPTAITGGTIVNRTYGVHKNLPGVY